MLRAGALRTGLAEFGIAVQADAGLVGFQPDARDVEVRVGVLPAEVAAGYAHRNGSHGWVFRAAGQTGRSGRRRAFCPASMSSLWPGIPKRVSWLPVGVSSWFMALRHAAVLIPIAQWGRLLCFPMIRKLAGQVEALQCGYGRPDDGDGALQSVIGKGCFGLVHRAAGVRQVGF